MPLNCLKLGQFGIVKKVCASDQIKRRLLDMGLIEGTKVECMMKSPLGNPIAYGIRGTVIAIRNEDCKEIMVELV